jgi:hypothetical protein
MRVNKNFAALEYSSGGDAVLGMEIGEPHTWLIAGTSRLLRSPHNQNSLS